MKSSKDVVRTNDVTLFSNGIGHFRRIYKITANQEEKISIPFKRDHIGDVAASLQVFGQVKYDAPPSFTPSNANATALRIHQDNSLQSIVQSLSGAQIELQVGLLEPVEYTLLGMHVEHSTSQNTLLHEKYLVVMSESGLIKRFAFKDIVSINFLEDAVRTEISKALKNNFQQIKPDSTLLEISLSSTSDKDTEATIQYTVPVAAWKMRYSIREDKGKFVLDGAAIIDNNTDEDWDNFYISVVTGNPISFSTDIANVVVPKRRMINLIDDVDQQVPEQGSSEVCSFESVSRGVPKAQPSKSSLGPKISTGNYASFGLESVQPLGGYEAPFAESSGVESKDVGDFCVFTSKEPISILARKSAVVPMFTVPLSKAGVVLLYKESNNSRRPYRSIKFKNESQYSLGKGKTVIYNEGVFSGECILDATKPGENRMLSHCIENGIKVIKESKDIESRTTSLSISDGLVIDETVVKSETVYIIDNKKDESFKFALEHTNILQHKTVDVEFSGVEIKEKEKVHDGNAHRAYFEIGPKETVRLTVVETSVLREKISIGGNFYWVQSNVIDQQHPLAKDKQIQACIEIQKQIDECNSQIKACQNQRKDLEQQAERVRNNLSAAKDVATTPTVTQWVEDLDSTDKKIRTIDHETVPNLQNKAKKLQALLYDALRSVTLSWKE